MAKGKDQNIARISEADVERIAESLAPKLVKEIQESKHEFWIDPQDHYNSHMKMDRWVKSFDSAESIFWKAFIGLVVLGTVFYAGIFFWKR